ncbi:MAG: glycosyl hydrolase [Verrucomicrobia bacterium CG_4_10_14_3_um_filter_43_23]|nr:MAG: hypothetical protein AUJ82_00635 [Verrucomicrobia bacterium CG1_02_43_26]PIP59222.1 MAG: glycosyl hydrolase [Verrucomicrobia bacterium CG22_combo_CG10-13_8_21_14_all_43_17]PIX58594.1 MAG: glycosyl hydrolase [Verrucomicrobia bacterium CG_4_10_14_3_um_filter_43_23]PIY61046.1 MAG: glycosyl hydrolase [Verrucomicrobia bacterium CG_4_10_14_0_8_um_filter_43_34]PJA43887.1 MAG: glycosyl hydrolase [Verrucomicrobia bacterium CG_4_9_14_3_um_filter_43_20]
MKIDVVIIGINTENTLKSCIESVLNSNYPLSELQIYYVDGGSRDSSVSIAGRFPSIEIIELDTKYPTPGMGRNAGWRAGNAEWVQFLDSDTELHPDWLNFATHAIEDNIGAISGNLHEVFPKANIYHFIAHLEWGADPGESQAFGGNVFMRRSILQETGGYREDWIVGEDPDLSQRIHKLNHWKIIHIDAPMGRHNIAMKSFGQYWKRAYRSGYGYAAICGAHGLRKGSFWVYELGRIMARGGGFVGLSFVAFICLLFGQMVGILIFLLGLCLLLYPRLFRIDYFRENKKIDYISAKRYAWHCSFVVIPQFFGIMRYVFGVMSGSGLRNRVK